MSANTFAAETDQMPNSQNQILQAVSMDEAEEVLKHVQVDFSSEKGLIKDIEPTVTVQKVVSPMGRSAESGEMYAITVEQPVVFSTGITDTEYAPHMDASIRGTIYYTAGGLVKDYYESFRLEYRRGAGIIISHKTYKAGFAGHYISGSVSSAAGTFTKQINQTGSGSMHLNAYADVSGNGSTDSIALNIKQTF